MHLHQSNQTEVLAAELARLMREDPCDPFAPEWIVVQHPAMERWLRLQLAEMLDIAANIRTELPSKFAWLMMRGACPDLPWAQPYAPEQLRWRIYEALPKLADEPVGEAVGGYLADRDARKRFELAHRIAQVFDRCLLYRPDWIRAWEGGDMPDGHERLWQARLWQLLTARETPEDAAANHWVAAVDAFKEALETKPPSGAQRPRIWPRRACFFAVSALSPSYLDLLGVMDEHIDIHLFALNPCREYWGDIYSRHEIQRKAQGADPAEQYLTEGNELLAAWGRAGRSMFDVFNEIPRMTPTDHFAASTTDSCLAAVQRDILDLRAASDGVDEGTGADGTLQIHVCHSPTREAEVLHDRLLDLFARHEDLQPAHVLVLTPNIAVYGPAIEAVFSAAGRIPVNVARTRGSGERILPAFLDLLKLSRSRLGVEDVLAPLDALAIRARFGLQAANLPTIRDRIREAGIRWGMDAAHRQAEGLPASGDHTWWQGIRRILLGYAMSDTSVLVGDLVPCPPGEFDESADKEEALGRFLTYCDEVFALRERLAGKRSPGQWVEILYEEASRFLADGSTPCAEADADEVAQQADAVRQLIAHFAQESEGSASPIPFLLACDVLGEKAAEVERDPVRLADGVTVASLGPGRVFPARVVCLVGMNDGVYPHSPHTPSFDVIAQGEARRGDRDARHEDRFAFLEALLAARRCLLVSYSGAGLRDDMPIPPSVLVDELKDYLGVRFPAAHIETHHPLQPFSPRYFLPEATNPANSGLFSYSQGMCEAAKNMRPQGTRGVAEYRRFTRLKLPVEQSLLAQVYLDDLIRFFANPTKFFLVERLGIRLETEDLVIDENEPLTLSPLDSYHLHTQAWENVRTGLSTDDAVALLQGSGHLPHGEFGRAAQHKIFWGLEILMGLLETYEEALEVPSREVSFKIDGCEVLGAIDGILTDRSPHLMVWWRMGRMRPQDYFEIWLKQLTWRVARNKPLAVLAFTDEGRGWIRKEFEPPKARVAKKLFGEYLKAWRRGLGELLPFFPNASFAHAKNHIKIRKKAEGMAKAEGPEAETNEEDAPDPNAMPYVNPLDALEAWAGPEFGNSRGDLNDAYRAFVYGNEVPLSSEFGDLAVDLIVPLLEPKP